MELTKSHWCVQMCTVTSPLAWPCKTTPKWPPTCWILSIGSNIQWNLCLSQLFCTVTFDLTAFVQYLGDGPMNMEKVVHIPKYVKPWYIYQLILSQLSWNEHSSGSDKINWYMYQDFTYFGMYHFPQSFWQKTIFLPTYNSWVCHN